MRRRYPRPPRPSNDHTAVWGGAPPALPAMFGIFGMHRIYTGHIGLGIAQLFTFGGCGIWQLIDIISIVTGKFTDKEGRPLKKDHPIRKLT